ncbi:MAG: methionine synthase [Oscillospiraceae bacterium]|nr:methionine synthase [Oscillospiraceae bacterium]
MTPIELTGLSLEEALRYMGTPPERADEGLRQLTEACAQELLAAVQPRWCMRLCAVSREQEGVRLDTGLLLPGQSLKEHLSGCTYAAVFCVTLGAQADGLIRRAQCTDMVRALALEGCADAAVESLCEQIEVQVKAQHPGKHFPFRFSPGYGDLPLTVQGELLALLDAPRKIGLCATASHILTPRKSVTAILGVGEQSAQPRKRSCADCPARDGCAYRKSGGHCGIS